MDGVVNVRDWCLQIDAAIATPTTRIDRPDYLVKIYTPLYAASHAYRRPGPQSGPVPTGAAVWDDVPSLVDSELDHFPLFASMFH